jgi:hypothetical protein
VREILRPFGWRHQPRVAGAGLLFAALALSLLFGCGDDPTPTRPSAPDSLGIPEGCGRIHGVIHGGLGPLSSSIEAYNPNTHQTYQTTSDSTGYYRLDIPRANYQLFVTTPDGKRRQWMPDGPCSGLGCQIMLTWENRLVRVDATFGAVRLGIPLLESCDGTADQVEFWHYELNGNLISFSPILYLLPHDGFLDVTVDFLLPGPYEIAIWRSGQHLILPRYPDGYGTFISVEAGHLTEWVRDLPMPAKIHGRLTGPLRELVDGFGEYVRPAVRWWRPGRFSEWGSASSVGPDGTFCLDLMLPDSVRLFIDAPRFWPHWVGGRREREATIFVPRPGEVLDVGDLPGAAIVVHFSREHARPLGVVELTLLADESDEVALSINADSLLRDPVDRLIFPHIDPGIYYLRARWWCGYDVPPWPEQWYPGVFSFADAQSVQVTSPEELMRLDWVIKESEGVAPERQEGSGDGRLGRTGVSNHRRSALLVHS